MSEDNSLGMVWETTDSDPSPNKFNSKTWTWTVDNDIANSMWVAAPTSGQIYTSSVDSPPEPVSLQPVTQTIVGTAATNIKAGDLVTLTLNGTSGNFSINNATTTFANPQSILTGINTLVTGVSSAVGTLTNAFTVCKYKPLTKAQKKKFEAVQKKNDKKRLREDKQLKLAHERSMKLLKRWLTKNEWDALINKGELEIPSTINNDEIYIIKKAAYEKVLLKKAGKLVSQHCLVTDKHYPDGDVLLNKILLLKTDEKQFLKIAVKTNYYSSGDGGYVYYNWNGSLQTAHEAAFHVSYAEPEPPRPNQFVHVAEPLQSERVITHADVGEPLPAYPEPIEPATRSVSSEPITVTPNGMSKPLITIPQLRSRA
jgi:hypothetical protein